MPIFGGYPNGSVDSIGRLGVGAVNLVLGGLLYLAIYLTLAPILGAVEKQDILNLTTLLGGTRIVAVLVNPVFNYEARLVATIGGD